MKQWSFLIGLIGGLWLGIQSVEAGVIINGTRVVYDGSRREAGISISNPDKVTPYLMQSWVENYSASDKAKVPFVITPPIFRLDAQQENVLRIVRTGGDLPEDRESVFLLNMKSIPASQQTDDNQLQITVKAQLKLFYRPESLKGKNADDAYKQLVFSKQGDKLVVRNPTPYFVSFHRVSVDGKEIENPSMVPPYDSLKWSMPLAKGKEVSWQAINDYGGVSPLVEMPL